MPTLQSGDSPGTRIAAGDVVLASAKSVSTKPIAARFAAFQKAHLAYRAADAKVKKATAALIKQQSKVGEADVDQDSAVMSVASALSGDGLPRLNPFKPFGAPPPTALCALGYDAEAKTALALVLAVQKRKGLSKGSIDAAKKLGAAAKKVQAALAPIPKLTKARTDAMSTREALAQGWETAFAGLKNAARAAEDDGVKGLYAALFERAPKPKSKAKGEPKAKPAAKGKAKPTAEAKATASEPEAKPATTEPKAKPAANGTSAPAPA
ncbi:MAG: hypothetical protein QM820_24330 [Minicystis sp.]